MVINRILRYKKNWNDTNGQMIVMMGVLLAISVLIISSIPSQISDVDVVISRKRSTSLLPEFIHIKEAFGRCLNYELVDITFSDDLSTNFYGDIRDIKEAFNRTRDSFYILELNHDTFFDAQFKNYWYVYLSPFYGYVYNVIFTLTLDNGKTSITEDVEYSIICNMEA